MTPVLRAPRRWAVPVLVLGAVAGCAGPDGPMLAVPGSASGLLAGVALPDVPRGEHVVITDAPLCVRADDGGRPEIRLVRAWPTAGSGVEVSDLGVRRLAVGEHGYDLGDRPDRTTLNALEDFRSRSVSVSCTDDGSNFRDDEVAFLGLEVIRTTEEPGHADGITVEYTVDGRRATADIPITVWLCPGRAAEDAEGCRT